jgi:hypothetical protein
VAATAAISAAAVHVDVRLDDRMPLSRAYPGGG